MEMEKYEVRVLLRHHWKQNYVAAVAAAKNICDVEGEDAVNDIQRSGGLNSLQGAI
jgi:hypothetical protein